MAHIHTFAGSPLDRAGNLRCDPDWLAGQLAAPDSRFLPLWQLRALMRTEGQPTISWLPADAVRPFMDQGAMVLFLGLNDGRAHFAVDVSAAGPEREHQPFRDHGRWLDVRSAAMQCPGPDAAILAQARSLIDWHARHGFCAVCGQPTAPREAGYARQCTDEACKAQHFPRTDPVVIMLVFHAGDVLLGRQRFFPKNSYSALAGFVEPGESLEEAVRREVMEEAGIPVGEVRYHSSQPWPFVSNLMIGCYAHAKAREITLDPHELEDARWFTRPEIADMVANAGPDESLLRMPPPLSIAHQLARAWLEESA